MAGVVCFDLEGPLSPQDNAYELMGLVEDGYRIFEVISRYDDVLTLEGRRGYEPGETLSLIIPFLVNHGISDDDVLAVSRRARIVDGVERVLSRIRRDWSAYVISTSYRQHALNIAGQLGIPKENVYATELHLDRVYESVRAGDLKLVGLMEKAIVNKLASASDVEVKKTLDDFYLRISKTTLGVLSTIKVVGGFRKQNALERITAVEGKKLSEVVAVGDSITDFKMLEAVRNNNGLAVVFNGNKYALPYGNVGLACSSMIPILALLDAFAAGGTKQTRKVALMWHKNRDSFNQHPEDIPAEYIPEDVREFLSESKNDKNFLKPWISSLLDLDEDEKSRLVEAHAKARNHVRGNAGKLG